MMESYLPDLQDSFFGIQDRPTELMASAAFQDTIVPGSDISM